MAKSGGKGGSVYDNAAGAMSQAGGALQDARGLVNGATLQQGGASTYTPFQYGAATGNAHLAAGPDTIASGYDRYMNPYTNDVINASANDITRQTQQQLMDVGSKASMSGAFGGSRHGLVEATTLSEAQKNIGDLSANLRNQGFNTAMGLSAQDVANAQANAQFNAGQGQQMTLANLSAMNLARGANAGAINTARQWNAGANNAWDINAANQNLAQAGMLNNLSNSGSALGQAAFGIGQSIDQAQATQGAQQQNLLQSLLDSASGQFSNYFNQPGNILSMMLQSLGQNPLNNATTTTGSYTPGIFDYLSLGAQMGAAKLGAK